jgi:hypothetical protein
MRRTTYSRKNRASHHFFYLAVALLLGGGVHDSADLGDLVPPALSIAHAWGQDNGASFL